MEVSVKIGKQESAQAEAEAKMRQAEAERKQQQEEQKRQEYINAGLCENCGKPLGMLDKIARRQAHSRC